MSIWLGIAIIILWSLFIDQPMKRKEKEKEEKKRLAEREQWYRERVLGLSSEYADGTWRFYKHGKLHNDLGPAVVGSNREYWINGEQLTAQEFQELQKGQQNK